MRLLFLSDVQADFESLDLCEQMAEEVLEICRERSLEGFVVAGDLKRVYNPADLRVVHFWMNFISRAKRADLRVILVLGNHDRIGMYVEAQNWFPILREAGAEIVHKGPKRINVKNGELYCLPFTSSAETTRKWSSELKDLTYSDANCVLVFHQDISGCAYNVLGQQSEGKLKVHDLFPSSYNYCLGGHVHLRQKLADNVWYIGNPFCSDWGEANQHKGYLVLEGKKLDLVPSAIPGWYDPSWPRFPKNNKNWKGCRIRVHVPIEIGKNYVTALDKAKREAEHKYAGALVYTVAEFKESETAAIKVKLSDSDAVKIEHYVQETLPEQLERHHRAIVTYLLYKLAKATEGLGLRTDGGARFLSARGERFLSFEKLEFDFAQPGLRSIVGQNKDWLGRSNGSGKTNSIQLIPVAMFGMTFKGQKHDSWALWSSTKTASVEVRFEDSRGRVIKVVRTRRPAALRLFVDGKEQSSGMQSSAQTATQGMIERLSGFTWQTLANAVYIDQQQVNTFLSGTASEQKRILERFQNLERFTKALEEVTRDTKEKSSALVEAESEKSSVIASLNAFEGMLEQEPADNSAYESSRKEFHKAKARYEVLAAKDLTRLKREHESYETQAIGIVERAKAAQQNLADAFAQRTVISSKLMQIRKVEGKTKCPMCLQEVDAGSLIAHIKEAELELGNANRKISIGQKLCSDADDALLFNNKAMRRTENTIAMYDSERDTAKSELDRWKRVMLSDKLHEQESVGRRRKLERKIKHAKRNVKFWTRQMEILTEEKALLDYCVTTFSRDGVPAFLNAQICPALNRAAEHYADIFTGKEIQVRFSMHESDFNVEVINVHGGQGLGDQSTGEKKMAALIASFALRAIAPKCNLLVLDEPADGLDSVNAKAFASGLKKLKDQLGTVLLTSHNPIIVGELSGESSIIVEKHEGISRIL
jgi:DNA repair exonuclease SbcCD nuclease subunit